MHTVQKLHLAENNKITGIDVNGVYTTQTKISFTAVGAGMDNNSPKKETPVMFRRAGQSLIQMSGTPHHILRLLDWHRVGIIR